MKTIFTLFTLFFVIQSFVSQTSSPYNYNPVTRNWSITGVGGTEERNDNPPVFTWQSVQTPVAYQIIKVFFIDVHIGWATHNGNGGLRTTDSGFNWITISFNDTNFTTLYNGAYFLDANTGWMVGGALQIRKTTNGGVNWFKQYAPPAAGVFNNIYFFDANTGIAIGRKTINYNSFIARTTNSGSNWTEIVATTANENELHSQYWFDANTGWICGRNTLLYSTNGGLNYTNLYTNVPPVSNGQNELLCITFVSSQKGWIGGSNLDSKNLYITTNSGSNWTFQSNPASFNTYTQINDVRFMTPDSGWAIHGTPATGAIMFTTNAGVNWVTEEGSSHWFNSIAIYQRSKAWCGADGGQIWYALLDQYVGITSNNNRIPTSFQLDQNFPNPFNPSTRIEFEIPANRTSGNSSVRLDIFDVLGRNTATLVNQYLKPGIYDVGWDASNYTSGVYFYRMEAENFVDTKRMVLIK